MNFDGVYQNRNRFSNAANVVLSFDLTLFYKSFHVHSGFFSDFKNSHESNCQYINLILNNISDLNIKECLEIAESIESYTITIQKISELHKKQNIDPRDAERLNNEFFSLSDNLRSLLAPIICRFAINNVDFGQYIITTDRKLQQIDESFFEKNAKIEARIQEITNLKTQIEELAKSKALQNQKNIFNDAANDASNSSRFWFWLVLISSGAVLALSVCYFFLSTADAYQAKIVNISLYGLLADLEPKISVMIVPVYFALWSLKNYAANRHNYIVNRHRANALESFQLFVDATADQRIKDAVLLQATTAIFAPQDSGYSKMDVPNVMGHVVMPR